MLTFDVSSGLYLLRGNTSSKLTMTSQLSTDPHQRYVSFKCLGRINITALSHRFQIWDGITVNKLNQ